MARKFKVNPITGKLDRVLSNEEIEEGFVDKETYDADEDAIIDKAEELDDGAGNTATAADAKDAVDKKHTQNTDTSLDSGGANEVSAADLKSHKDSVANPHGTTHTQTGFNRDVDDIEGVYEDVVYYVNPSTGNDSTGQPDSETYKFASMGGVLAVLPKRIEADVEIYLEAGTYPESTWNVQNFHGGGYLYIYGDGDTTIFNGDNLFAFEYNTIPIFFYDVEFHADQNSTRMLSCVSNIYLELANIGFENYTDNLAGSRAIDVIESGIAVISDCYDVGSNKFKYGFRAQWKTKVHYDGTAFGHTTIYPLSEGAEIIGTDPTNSYIGSLSLNDARGIYQNVTYYVNPSTGNDATGQPNSETYKYASLGGVLTVLPKRIEAQVEIYLEAGTYSEQTWNVQNFHGGGYIYIYGDGDTSVFDGDNLYSFQYNTVPIWLESVKFKPNNDRVGVVVCTDNSDLSLWSIGFESYTDNVGTAIKLQTGGKVYIYDCNDSGTNTFATGVSIAENTEVIYSSNSLGNTAYTIAEGGKISGTSNNRIGSINLDTLNTQSHTHSNKAQLDLVTDGDHDVRTDNPHNVTKAQVGLTNVPDLDTTDAVNNEHTHSVAEDVDFDTDEVLNTGIGESYGMLIARESTSGITAIYRVDNQTLTTVSADATFSTTKDTASKYNVYWETDQFKVQNKVGDNKNIRVGAFLI